MVGRRPLDPAIVVRFHDLELCGARAAREAVGFTSRSRWERYPGAALTHLGETEEHGLPKKGCLEWRAGPTPADGTMRLRSVGSTESL